MSHANPSRRSRMYRRNYGGPWVGYDHADAVRSCGCAMPSGCRGGIAACHIKARGMGGTGGDWKHLVPLCAEHHRFFDEQCANRPEFFKGRTGVDLIALAARLVASAVRLNGPIPEST